MDAGLLSFFYHITECFLIVHTGLRICHQNHGGVAALCRCLCAGFDVFFIGKARVPEMGMHIHESRRRHKPLGINHPERSRFCRQFFFFYLTDFNNFSVF